jgi:putative N-acetylmannosamine-6-phosphate epimerase
VTAPRRALSHAISEGDGISLIVEVDGPDAARAAEQDGAEALLVTGADLESIRATCQLPLLAYYERTGDAADALIVLPDVEWSAARAETGETIELAVWIEREEELEQALELHDPELLVLAARDRDNPLEHVLALLSDVPAGKLAIADLGHTTDAEIAELERAGCDAVLVGARARTS